MPDIVVVGGTGYIGRYLVRRLYNKFPGSRISLVSRNKSRMMFFSDMKTVRFYDKVCDLDLRDGVVFNLAYDTGFSYKETRCVNESIIMDLFRGLNNNFKGVVIHMSSVAVYDIDGSISDCHPDSVRRVKKTDLYSYAKGYQEKLLFDICKHRNINLLIVRCGNVMGPGSTWVNKTLRRLINREPLVGLKEVHPSNTTFIANLVYALTEYAEAYRQFAKCINIVNFAEFGNTVWNAWIEIFANYLGIKPETWGTDCAKDFRSSVLREIRSIIESNAKDAIRSLYKGVATHTLLTNFLDLCNASKMRAKVGGFVRKGGTKRKTMDFSEYRTAQIYLSCLRVGLEGNQKSVSDSLPYTFSDAKKSLTNWMLFAGYDCTKHIYTCL